MLEKACTEVNAITVCNFVGSYHLDRFGRLPEAVKLWFRCHRFSRDVLGIIYLPIYVHGGRSRFSGDGSHPLLFARL